MASSAIELSARPLDGVVALRWAGEAILPSSEFLIFRGAQENGPFQKMTSQPLRATAWVDHQARNGSNYYYYVQPTEKSVGLTPSKTHQATPVKFKSDAEFLNEVQHASFDYFWFEANPTNGLIRDFDSAASCSSIAAIGFGLTAIGVGVDHSWINRESAAARTLMTLNTLLNAPMTDADNGSSGYRGWYYHFLDFQSGVRMGKSELSSIDSALLFSGIIYAREYFNSANPVEVEIRHAANAILKRVDWKWMCNGKATLTHGWNPETGFLPYRWVGYNEASMLYLFGLGSSNEGLTPDSWKQWTAGYEWQTSYGFSYVHFAPLFGHQYPQCWIDFRNITDDYMRSRQITYFENSRRATLAQRAYAVENPRHFKGYNETSWGNTACDGPGVKGFYAYMARGTPNSEFDDGTIAPTAVAGSIPFSPEVCIPTLRHLFDSYKEKLWTSYGFADSFNLQANWWSPITIGIDQGPIVLMIENHLTGKVWETMMKAPELQKGLQKAGFQKFDARRPQTIMASAQPFGPPAPSRN
ncbi:MAG: hypothetical protein JWN25_2246 [Verrucomicrobiales bacterium]|nr:hypothetical protein [Verrucomicrobiales bacterium]